MFRQNLPHQICSNTQKMRATRVIRVLRAQESQIDFVNQGGGLQGVLGPLAPQVPGSDLVQLTVNDGHQVVESCAVPIADTIDQERDVAIQVSSVAFRVFAVERSQHRRQLPIMSDIGIFRVVEHEHFSSRLFTLVLGRA